MSGVLMLDTMPAATAKLLRDLDAYLRQTERMWWETDHPEAWAQLAGWGMVVMGATNRNGKLRPIVTISTDGRASLDLAERGAAE